MRQTPSAAYARGRDLYLHRVQTGFTWKTADQVPVFMPASTIGISSSCRSETVAISSHGVSLSQSNTVCPEKIDPDYVPLQSFFVFWYGSAYNESRYTEGADVIRRPQGVCVHSGYVYHFEGTYSTYDADCGFICQGIP